VADSRISTCGWKSGSGAGTLALWTSRGSRRRDWMIRRSGLLFSRPLGDCWRLNLRGEVGGFGLAPTPCTTCWLLPLAGIENTGIFFGYRSSLDYEDGDGRDYQHYDLTEQGPDDWCEHFVLSPAPAAFFWRQAMIQRRSKLCLLLQCVALVVPLAATAQEQLAADRDQTGGPRRYSTRWATYAVDRRPFQCRYDQWLRRRQASPGRRSSSVHRAIPAAASRETAA